MTDLNDKALTARAAERSEAETQHREQMERQAAAFVERHHDERGYPPEVKTEMLEMLGLDGVQVHPGG